MSNTKIALRFGEAIILADAATMLIRIRRRAS